MYIILYIFFILIYFIFLAWFSGYFNEILSTDLIFFYSLYLKWKKKMENFSLFQLITLLQKALSHIIDLYHGIPGRIDFRVDIIYPKQTSHVHLSFTLHPTRLLVSRTFIMLIFTCNIPLFSSPSSPSPALSQAIVRSVLSARWIQIVLRQQGYNPGRH